MTDQLTITIAGPMGSGKTRLLAVIRAALTQHGIVVHDRERDDQEADTAVVSGFDPRKDWSKPALLLNAYQARTADTAIYPGKGTPLGLIYCGLKLAGEAGEVSEKIGKAIRDDGMMGVDGHAYNPGLRCDTWTFGSFAIKPERREALKGELGDVLWYVASAARELGCDLSDIAQANLDKLAGRKERGTLSGSGDNR